MGPKFPYTLAGMQQVYILCYVRRSKLKYKIIKTVKYVSKLLPNFVMSFWELVVHFIVFFDDLLSSYALAFRATKQQIRQ